MRRLLAGALALTLLAGCGGSEAERQAAAPMPKGDFGPEKPGQGEFKRPDAPPAKKPSAAVAKALAAGQVGVIGVEGVVGVRPRSLDVSADGTLEDLTWKEWGDRSAVGAGELRLRDCDPSCASGGIESYDATIRLSAPRLCGRATYFDKARVEIGEDMPPTTYVRAPC